MVPKQAETTQARITQAKNNEAMVLAEAALLGERVVSIVRVLVLLARALVFAPILERSSAQLDVVMLSISSAYFFVSMLIMVGVWRFAKPNPRRANTIPTLIMLVDFSFVVTAGVVTSRHGHPLRPEMGAISFAILIAFHLARTSIVPAVVSTVLASGCYVLMLLTLGHFDLAGSIFVVIGFIALGGLVARMNVEIRKMFVGLRRRDNLTRLLPASVVERVLAEGDQALAPVQREVTVLFLDIRDFTALSEALPPRSVLEFLDGFFGHMSQIVKAHDGTVNKFLGDGMLAFWGVPNSDSSHARKSILAALDIRMKLAEINAGRGQAGEAAVRIGMGIHTGIVAAGMLGGADQHEYTVIGDAVNLASRVEGLTKTLNVDLLVSEKTWSQAEEHFSGTRLAEEKVRGRQEVVVVYSVEEKRLTQPSINAARL